MEALKGKVRSRKSRRNIQDNEDKIRGDSEKSSHSIEGYSVIQSDGHDSSSATSIASLCAELNSLLSMIKSLYTIQSDVIISFCHIYIHQLNSFDSRHV